MTPQEITKAVEAAIESQSMIPLWTYVLMVILPLLGAGIGAYVKKKGENLAENEDFKQALSRIERQVDSVKKIEEKISHEYLEEREISRMKREKIELIYEYVEKEVEQICTNLSTAGACMNRDTVFPTNKTQMLISLYFKEDLGAILDIYLEHRKLILTHIRKLEEANYHRNNQQFSMAENIKVMNEGNQLISNLSQAKNQIEIGLEEVMENLTSRSSKDAKNGAA